MQLIEVLNAGQAKDFIKVNIQINQANPNYIRPLDKDINDVFDPKKIKHFAMENRSGGSQKTMMENWLEE